MKTLRIERPLDGVRVLELEGIGPGPVAGYILQQLGAQVTLVARPTPIEVSRKLGKGVANPLQEGKDRAVIDLKSPVGRDGLLRLVTESDVLLEGLRPGVMERLGVGPQDCARANPKLIYARMTGWGQDGPLADAAGHDLNYVALSGLLAIGRRTGEVPIVPPTVLGDAAGGLGTAFGVACALFDVRRSGIGRVIDSAMLDIAAMLGVLAQWMHGAGQLEHERPSPLLGSPFYEVYQCADGKFVAIGCVEPAFFALLLEKLGIGDVDPNTQYDSAHWTTTKSRLKTLFASRARSEWCALLEGSDACFAPVLEMDEAPGHPHNVARAIFEPSSGGLMIARAAPRFSSLPTAENSQSAPRNPPRTPP